MVEEMAARSSSAGAKLLTLKVKSPRARQFYRRHGFTQVGEDGCYYLLERNLTGHAA